MSTASSPQPPARSSRRGDPPAPVEGQLCAGWTVVLASLWRARPTGKEGRGQREGRGGLRAAGPPLSARPTAPQGPPLLPRHRPAAASVQAGHRFGQSRVVAMVHRIREPCSAQGPWVPPTPGLPPAASPHLGPETQDASQVPQEPLFWVVPPRLCSHPFCVHATAPFPPAKASSEPPGEPPFLHRPLQQGPHERLRGPSLMSPAWTAALLVFSAGPHHHPHPPA